MCVSACLCLCACAHLCVHVCMWPITFNIKSYMYAEDPPWISKLVGVLSPVNHWGLYQFWVDQRRDRLFLLFAFLLLLFLLLSLSFFSSYSSPRREAGDVWCLPPVWHLRAVIWFHFAISCLVLLPSPVTPSVLPFFLPAGPFFWTFFLKILQYFSLRDRLFCMGPV